MIEIVSNAYFGSIITLFCLISSQFCSINCNIIKNNKDVFERRVISKVSIGTNDSHVSNEYKKENVGTFPIPILRERSSETDQLTDLSSKLYRNNRVLMPHMQHMPHQNLMALNRKPMYPNIYQMPLSYPSKNYNSAQQQNNNYLKDKFDIIDETLKKYDMKKFFLKKILGESYEAEEEHKDGFFGGQHLKRHGTAGMAAKIFGELIGIKIRETIEEFGKTISGYAKDFTTNGFVSIGNSVNKLFRN